MPDLAHEAVLPALVLEFWVKNQVRQFCCCVDSAAAAVMAVVEAAVSVATIAYARGCMY